MLNPYFPKAVWAPLPGRDTTPGRVQLLTVHTAVSNSANLYGKGRLNGGTYAHFYNPKTGPLIQYQEIGHIARADNYGNPFTISVENWDGGYAPEVPPLTASQIENLAQLFAWLVKTHDLANRIATPENLTGLGWHRLGIRGNFGPYNPADRRTWSGAQSGVNFSGAFGKVCPGNRRIDQIPEIYARAQQILAPQPKTIPLIDRSEKMFIIYRSSGKKSSIKEYAIVGSNFFMPFTGEAAATNLTAQLGGKPALRVSDKFWNHCRAAAGK